MNRKWLLQRYFIVFATAAASTGCGLVDRATELLVNTAGTGQTDENVAATAAPESQPTQSSAPGGKPPAAPSVGATPLPTPTPEAPATAPVPAAAPPVGSLAEAAGQTPVAAPTLPTTVATQPAAGTPSALPAGGKPPSSEKPDGSGSMPGMLCTNTCATANDQECDDGGPLSVYSICELGTDCADCGPRPLR